MPMSMSECIHPYRGIDVGKFLAGRVRVGGKNFLEQSMHVTYPGFSIKHLYFINRQTQPSTIIRFHSLYFEQATLRALLCGT